MADTRRFSLPYEFDRDTVMEALSEPPQPVMGSQGQPDLGAEEMQRLFDMTNKQPFGGYRPEIVSEEGMYFPQSPGSLAEDNSFPLYLASYIIGKIQNDRFIHGPPDGTGSTLDDETNKLPGWSVVDGTANGGAVVWNDDGNGVGTLQFYVTDGEVGDKLYIEQDIFVSGGNYDILSVAADWIGTTDAGGGVEGKYDTFIEYAWYYPDGTINGSLSEQVYSNDTDERLDRMWLVTSSRQNGFLKIRIGVKVDTAWTSGQQNVAKLTWTWLEDPESYDVTLPFMRDNWTPAGSGLDLHMFCHANPYGVSNWTAPGPGFILSISAYTTDTITAGFIRFFPRVAGTAKSTDPYSCVISDGEVKSANFRDPSGQAAFDFNALQLIDVRANASTSPDTTFASTGNAPYAGSLQCRIVVAFDADNPDGPGGPFGPASS